MAPVWLIGPLRIALGALVPPPDWSHETDDAGAVDVALVCSEESVSASGAPIDPVVCIETARDVLHLERRGGFRADVDLAARTGRYAGELLRADGNPAPGLETFLRALTAAILLRRGGALLHASSVAHGGSGYAFCGVSGAGKTTLVRNTVDGVYLADDQTLVAPDPVTGALSVWGSPFRGDAQRRAPPIHAPLRAVTLLSPSRPTHTALVARTDRGAAAGELLRHVCCFEGTAAEASRALAFAGRVVRDVGVFSLARHLDDTLDDIVARLSTAAR